MTFQSLGLAAELLKAVEQTGYTTPTPVQMQAIPAAIAGRDLLVSSHTGSGKTAAFTLPALHKIIDRRPAQGSGPRVLVLTPTRELAQQVEKAVQTYGKALRWLNTACLVGGAPMFAQIKQLQRQCDVVVATPGRLLDHLTRRKIKLSDVEVLILDEADRMLDMGFAEDIDAIVAATPAKRQTLLFSATLDGVVGSMATRMTRDPQRIEIEVAQEDRGQIEQRLMFADDLGHKSRLLHALLGEEGMNQAVVFTATKRSADELSLSLQEKGIAAAALHGDMHQTQRNRTLDRLRQGRIGVLVATDVAARGIDVAGISHVINFDPPRQAEDWLHRIGRTRSCRSRRHRDHLVRPARNRPDPCHRTLHRRPSGSSPPSPAWSPRRASRRARVLLATAVVASAVAAASAVRAVTVVAPVVSAVMVIRRVANAATATVARAADRVLTPAGSPAS